MTPRGSDLAPAAMLPVEEVRRGDVVRLNGARFVVVGVGVAVRYSRMRNVGPVSLVALDLRPARGGGPTRHYSERGKPVSVRRSAPFVVVAAGTVSP